MSERPAAPADDHGQREPERDSHRLLLGRRLRIDIRVRGFMVAAILAGALVAHYGLGLRQIDLTAIAALAAVIALYDVVVWVLTRGRTGETSTGYRRLLEITYAATALDFLALTGLVWLMGGVRSPFAAFYLLHVIVSAVLLTRRATLALVGLAYSLLGLLVLGEWSGLLPPRLRADEIGASLALGSAEALTLLAVYAVLFGLTAYIALGLTAQLREVETRIRLANEELRRLSELRKGFLHIAVHNLKAPIGAVTLFLENLRSGLAGPVTTKQEEWLERSLKRLGDLSEFMQNLQTLSSLEAGIISERFTRVDLGAVAERVVEDYREVARSHGHTLSVYVERPLPQVVGHERLLGEALLNYLTNAFKYTPDGGRVQVRVIAREGGVRVEVQDSGVGIATADQPRLFREFVRLAHESSAVAGVEGSGLGLSIVKRIADAHGGSVGVESQPGHGSTFHLQLPGLRE